VRRRRSDASAHSAGAQTPFQRGRNKADGEEFHPPVEYLIFEFSWANFSYCFFCVKNEGTKVIDEARTPP